MSSFSQQECKNITAWKKRGSGKQLWRWIIKSFTWESKSETLEHSWLQYVACGRVRWLWDCLVQDTAVQWALSSLSCVLIQEGYTMVLDLIQNRVGCWIKPPIVGVECSAVPSPVFWGFFIYHWYNIESYGVFVTVKAVYANKTVTSTRMIFTVR